MIFSVIGGFCPGVGWGFCPRYLFSGASARRGLMSVPPIFQADCGAIIIKGAGVSAQKGIEHYLPSLVENKTV